MNELGAWQATVLLLGGLGVVGIGLANARGAWAWLAGWVLLTFGFAWFNRALVWPWVLESLWFDLPWGAVLLLAAWTLVGAAGVVRATSFPGVVLVSALAGSFAACVGATLAEPDERRRARLVVAASGAALISPWGAPASLAIGGHSLAVSALGVVLALAGLAGGGAVGWARPDRAAAGKALLLLLWLALLVWLMRQGGVPDYLASGLESLPMRLPGRAASWLGMVSAIVGALVHPAGAALLGGLVVEHGTQLRGGWAPEAIRIGLTVGAGLPALWLSRAKISVGVPLWALQVIVAVAFLAWRYPG